VQNLIALSDFLGGCPLQSAVAALALVTLALLLLVDAWPKDAIVDKRRITSDKVSFARSSSTRYYTYYYYYILSLALHGPSCVSILSISVVIVIGAMCIVFRSLGKASRGEQHVVVACSTGRAVLAPVEKVEIFLFIS
jgi:hypothetical protein